MCTPHTLSLLTDCSFMFGFLAIPTAGSGLSCSACAQCAGHASPPPQHQPPSAPSPPPAPRTSPPPPPPPPRPTPLAVSGKAPHTSTKDQPQPSKRGGGPSPTPRARLQSPPPPTPLPSKQSGLQSADAALANKGTADAGIYQAEEEENSSQTALFFELGATALVLLFLLAIVRVSRTAPFHLSSRGSKLVPATDDMIDHVAPSKPKGGGVGGNGKSRRPKPKESARSPQLD